MPVGRPTEYNDLKELAKEVWGVDISLEEEKQYGALGERFFKSYYEQHKAFAHRGTFKTMKGMVVKGVPQY